MVFELEPKNRRQEYFQYWVTHELYLLQNLFGIMIFILVVILNLGLSKYIVYIMNRLFQSSIKRSFNIAYNVTEQADALFDTGGPNKIWKWFTFGDKDHHALYTWHFLYLCLITLFVIFTFQLSVLFILYLTFQVSLVLYRL